MKDQDIATIVEKMATLARMRVNEADFNRFAEKVQSVLAYVQQLTELDTSGIEPTSHAVFATGNLREDAVVPSAISAAMIEASPERDGPYVQVPKVIDSA